MKQTIDFKGNTPFTNNNRIFLDTSALTETASGRFWGMAAPAIRKAGAKAVVPLKTWRELTDRETDPDARTRVRASDAMKRIERLRKDNILELMGEERDLKNERLFEDLFARFKNEYDLVLITQNETLAKSVSIACGAKLNAWRIKPNGTLEQIDVSIPAPTPPIGGWRSAKAAGNTDTKSKTQRTPSAKNSPQTKPQASPGRQTASKTQANSQAQGSSASQPAQSAHKSVRADTTQIGSKANQPVKDETYGHVKEQPHTAKQRVQTGSDAKVHAASSPNKATTANQHSNHASTAAQRDSAVKTAVSAAGKAASRPVRRVNSLVLGPFATLVKQVRSLTASSAVPSEERFAKSTALTVIEDRKLVLDAVPTEGDTVHAAGKPVMLEEELASGGEGKIYRTNTPYVAKIYKKERLTKRREEKIRLMLSHPVSYPGICYPAALVTDSSGRFAGYLMPKAQGVELQRSLFVKALLEKNFPEWTKRDTVSLCITILRMINHLNARNIIMGDINPLNILVRSPEEVYFVDTDSYQIEGFPCPVGTVNYTAPEIQGETFSDFLRSPGHENFAIATLLFMIMLPGKPPYSQQGGNSPRENIINMDFSYPFKDATNHKTPKGPWGAIWSHLPDAVQEAFYCTFRTGACFATEKKRLSGEDWLGLFSEYLELLDEPAYLQEDPQALAIFPKRYRGTDPSKPKKKRKKTKKQTAQKTASPPSGQRQQAAQTRQTPHQSAGTQSRQPSQTQARQPNQTFRPNRQTGQTQQTPTSRRPQANTAQATRTVYPNYKAKPVDANAAFVKAANNNIKMLICRKCHGTFPEDQMKQGLCEHCRQQQPTQAGRTVKKDEKTLICRKCHGTFPEDQMLHGLCDTCRAAAGQTAVNTNMRAPFRKRQQEKTLICRKCHGTFPEDQMLHGLCDTCRGAAPQTAQVQTYQAYSRKAPERPTSFGQSRARMVRCTSCQRGFPENELRGGLCPDCIAAQKPKAPPFGQPAADNTARRADMQRRREQERILAALEFERQAEASRSAWQRESSPPTYKKPDNQANNTKGWQRQWRPGYNKEQAQTTSFDSKRSMSVKPDERREQAKSAINEVFKDTPSNKLNEFVEWLISK